MTEASNYISDYGSPIPVRHLTDRVASYIHAYTLYSAVRPFGTTIMFGTYTDTEGPELFCVENSGLYYRYWGAAVSYRYYSSIFLSASIASRFYRSTFFVSSRFSSKVLFSQ